jgi:hypothetical protein
MVAMRDLEHLAGHVDAKSIDPKSGKEGADPPRAAPEVSDATAPAPFNELCEYRQKRPIDWLAAQLGTQQIGVCRGHRVVRGTRLGHRRRLVIHDRNLVRAPIAEPNGLHAIRQF